MCLSLYSFDDWFVFCVCFSAFGQNKVLIYRRCWLCPKLVSWNFCGVDVFLDTRRRWAQDHGFHPQWESKGWLWPQHSTLSLWPRCWLGKFLLAFSLPVFEFWFLTMEFWIKNNCSVDQSQYLIYVMVMMIFLVFFYYSVDLLTLWTRGLFYRCIYPKGRYSDLAICRHNPTGLYSGQMAKTSYGEILCVECIQWLLYCVV